MRRDCLEVVTFVFESSSWTLCEKVSDTDNSHWTIVVIVYRNAITPYPTG